MPAKAAAAAAAAAFCAACGSSSSRGAACTQLAWCRNGNAPLDLTEDCAGSGLPAGAAEYHLPDIIAVWV